MTYKFGLVGEKLSYSYSPIIHNKIMELINIKGTYDIIEVKREDSNYIVERLKTEQYNGVNITIPYKILVMNEIDDISREAKAIGAVNTLSFNKNLVKGYNTDYFGFYKLLEHKKIAMNGKNAVILGTGGASRAVLQCLVDNDINNITFVTRDIQQAKNKYNDYKILSYDEVKNIEHTDICINCTPVGMSKYINQSPLVEDVLYKFDAMVDLIYNPTETKLLNDSRKLGLKTANGLYMLVAQAVKSQEIWHNINIDEKIIDTINDMLIKNMNNSNTNTIDII